MTRRALAVSVLGVAAPICLLAAAWVADQMFHPHGCRLSLGAQSAAVVEFEVVTGVEEDAFPDELNVSELRRMLLAERHVYPFWEGSLPDRPELLFRDEQFLRQRVLMELIEQASGQPPRDAIRLSAAERLQLHQDAAGCHGWRAATWLLHELDGAPLPRTAHNRAKRLACEGDWVPGDPFVE